MCTIKWDELEFNHIVEFTRDSTIFGATVHVLLDERIDAPQLEAFLVKNGLQVRGIRPIDPTLEDVFVTLTHLHDSLQVKGGKP